MARAHQTPAIVRQQIQKEANRAMRRAGLVAAWLGFVQGAAVLGLLWAGVVDRVELPAAFAIGAGLFSLLIHRLAKAQRLTGVTALLVFVPFVSLPTMFFAAAQLWLPAGAATYLTGPFSYLYFFLIVITGFLFEPRVPVAAGLASGAGYFGAYLLARPELLRIVTEDPALAQDLSAPAIYGLKAVMMAFTGLAVALIAVQARKLVVRTLAEQESRARIDRLFGQYVSDEVRDRLVQQTQEQQGERVAVAVLFSDVRSYSTFSEGRDPAVVVAQLNAYFDRMVGCIRAEGGMVDKFIGDAVMAVFGGVAAVAEPCEAALRAARRMGVALDELNREWSANAHPSFQHGIGIAFGDVVQGPIGSTERKEFTVIGDPVNVASRIEGLTKTHDYGVIVSGDVARQLSASTRSWLDALGSEHVKGKHQPVELYGLRKEAKPS